MERTITLKCGAFFHYICGKLAEFNATHALHAQIPCAGEVTFTMKPLLQQLPPSPGTSFVARSFRTPYYEVDWHHHTECELILFTNAAGLARVGNHIGPFERNDIYFLGPHLPHTFQKRHPDSVAEAMVVQFKEDFWGAQFIRVPENRGLGQLLRTAERGLKISGSSKDKLIPLIRALEHSRGPNRILMLYECLDIIAAGGDFAPLSTERHEPPNAKDAACIQRVLRFTLEHFKEPIHLHDIASVACKSVPAFCTYFKRTTKQSYIDFLNEVRVAHACTLLAQTGKPVVEICYESGYRTLSNFHKQFLKLKGLTPLRYRRQAAAFR